MSSRSPSASATAVAGPATVMVVDDETMIRAMARRVLERQGYHVLLAEHGQQALELYSAHLGTVGLVVLDMSMPIMSGPACFDGIRALDRHARILLSSGYTTSAETEFLLAQGAVGVVHKPYSLQKFSEAVALAMAQPILEMAMSR